MPGDADLSDAAVMPDDVDSVDTPAIPDNVAPVIPDDAVSWTKWHLGILSEILITLFSSSEA